MLQALRLLRPSPHSFARLLHIKNAFTTLLSDLEEPFQLEKIDKNRVARLLRGYKSREKDWQPFALFTKEKYTRNLVKECPTFCAIVLAWGPGHASSIHDHAGADCWVKVLDGELTETRYQLGEEGRCLEKVCQTVVRRDRITFMNDSLGLHVIANNSSHTAVTLHVYAPPFDRCLAFDEITGEPRASSCDFDSVRGEKKNNRK